MGLVRSLLLLSTIVTHSTLIKACGVLVHNEVLRRAQYLYSLPSSGTVSVEQVTRERFSQYLNAPESASVIQAGAFFPDWGYGCLWSDQDAEAAHWPPFQKAWAEYVIEKYGLQDGKSERVLNDDEQAHLQTLISFGFALSSHQSSDESWHSIRLASGFLKTVAMNDFDYNTVEAHKTIDIGGDIIFSSRFNVPNGSSWLSSSWSLPIADIIAVYARMGRSVSAARLRPCFVRGLAALKAELSFGPSRYQSYAQKSHTMATEIDSYYLGGMEEMASSAAYCWTNLTRWYVHGTPEVEGAEWGLCDIFRARGGRRPRDESEAHESEAHEGIPEYDLRASQEQAAAEKRIKLLSTDKFGVETYKYSNASEGAPSLRKVYHPSTGTDIPKFSGDPTYISTYNPYSQFGHALAAGAIGPVQSKSAPHIAITAPLETEDSYHTNAGSVYILPFTQLTGMNTQSTALKELQPIQLHQLVAETDSTCNVRFGHAMTTWTPHSNSNRSLLVISSTGPQIFDLSIPSSQHPAGKIDIFDGANKIQTWYGFGAPLGWRGVKLWGEILASGALTGTSGEELIIGSPMSDGDEKPPPECPWGFFYAQRGFVQVARYDETGATQKGERSDGPRIRVQAHTHSSGTLTAPQIWTIYPPVRPAGQDPCALLPPPRFGAAVAVVPSSRTLLVGAPGANIVYAYRYDSTKADFVRVFSISLPEEIEGKKVDFGGKILTGTTSDGANEWIAISSPGEGGGNGKVRIYVLEENGNGAKLVAEVADADEEKLARFGRVLSIGRGQQGGVWVGSGYAAEERGVVWWFDIDTIIKGSLIMHGGNFIQNSQVVLGSQILAGANEVKEFKAERVLIGPEEQKAHFGESLYSADIDGDGVGDLVVGLPLAGTNGENEKRLTGAIAVYMGVAARVVS